MAFNHKYNTDDVIIRACIVGLVNELNNRINYYNVWEDTRSDIVRVPFFYAMSGDERFLQDYFTDWSDCAPDFIEGNTDPIPRGTIFLTGVSVLASNLTSRYVRGYYNKEIEGELKRFNSYINSIPIQMNFTAEILADTTVDTFKIVQSAIGTLYKTLVFNVNFKGLRVPIQAGFPDNFNIEKQFEFTYGATDRLKVTFDIELQGYLPLTDPTQEFFGGKNLQGFSYNMSPGGTGTVTNVTPPPISTDASNYMFPSVEGDPITGNTTPGDGGNNQGTYGGYGTEPPTGYVDPPPRRESGSGGNIQDGNSQFGENNWQ